MAGAAALAAAAILAALAVFQAQLAAGRPLGRFAWGGAHDVLPPPLGVASATSILAAYFLIGVAMNAASRSADERRVLTPVALALCVLCVGVALG